MWQWQGKGGYLDRVRHFGGGSDGVLYQCFDLGTSSIVMKKVLATVVKGANAVEVKHF